MSRKGKKYYSHHIGCIIDAYDKFVREPTEGEKGHVHVDVNRPEA